MTELWRSAQGRSSLRRLGTGSHPSVRLVCFPWCGAGASSYRRLAARLPNHIELLAMQLPGREDRLTESKLLRMEQIVEHAVGDIMSVYDRPLVLFGHSLGALIAYEVALVLKEKFRREPDALIVSGQSSPDRRDASGSNWHTADDARFIAQLRELGGTTDEILEDRKMMSMLLPILRADYEAVETYLHRPRPPLSCPLVACAGDRDGEVCEQGIDAWRRYTTGPFKSHWFSGDHFYLSSQPEDLAEQLREWTAPNLMHVAHHGQLHYVTSTI